MSRPLKKTYIGARFTNDEVDEIREYVESTDTDLSELVRNAVREYLRNHPVEGEEKSDG